MRLFYAPINLDFAREAVVQQAETFLPGWQVDFGSAMIGWDWGAVRPWVAIEELELIDRRNRLTATIPEVRLHVSYSGLATGISLAEVQVSKAQVLVSDLAGFSDSTDGSLFSDLLLGEGVPRPEIFRPVTEAFSRFTVRLLDNAPGLEEVRFDRFHVELVRGEGLSNISFTAPQFTLERNRELLSLSAQVDATIANNPTRLRVSGRADPYAGDLTLSLGFNEPSLAHLSEQAGLSEPFTYMHFPVDFDLNLDMAASDGLRAANLTVAVAEGYLYDEIAFPDQSPINYGIITAAYDPVEQVMAIDQVELSLGGTVARGGGLLYWIDGFNNPGVELSLEVDRVSVADVQKYWPIKRHPDGRMRGARGWVHQHMLGGWAENVKWDINLDPDGTSPYPNDSFFELTFDFSEVDTHFLKTMPPIQGAAGQATLSRQLFDIALDTGDLEGMAVAGTRAHLYDIHVKGGGQGDFDLKIDGNVPKVLEILSYRPVYIDQRIKMDLERIRGDAVIAGRLSLPLINGAPKESIRYTMNAAVTDGSVSDLLNGPGLTGAKLELLVDNDHLRASGNGNVNGVPLNLYWSEDFKTASENAEADTTLLVLSGDVDEKGLQALGVDVSEYLQGQSFGEATFLGRNFNFRAGYFSADASLATLKIPQIGWEKHAAVPANINGTVYFDNPGTRIEPLTITGEKIDTELTVTWPSDNRNEFDLVFNAKQLGKSSFIAEAKSEADGNSQVVVDAKYLDITGLLAEKQSAGGEQARESSSTVDLALKAEKLELLNGTVLDHADVRILFEDEPKLFALSASTEFGLSTVKISPSQEERQPLLIQSPDGGALLRGMGYFAHMEGGELTLEGDTNGWADTLSVAGRMNIKDSRLIAKNRLGEQVTEGVISGVDDYLDGGTLDLDVVKFPFTFDSGLLDISKVKANGPSMGMTMEGQIDTDAGKINVNGVVVPAYGLNSLLGKIPLVGGIFSGGDGKGLFGVAYRVKGSTEEPDVNVNALSGLAPGFLRVLFEGRKGNVDRVTLPEEEVAEPKAEEPKAESVDGSENSTGKP